MFDWQLEHRGTCLGSECESCLNRIEQANPTSISNIKRSIDDMDLAVNVQKKKRLNSNSSRVSNEQKACLDNFDRLSDQERVDLICMLLSRMSYVQHSQINKLLEPLLQRDFITALPARGVPHLSEAILLHLDAKSLFSAELVSHGWRWAVARFQLWRRLIARCVETDSVWNSLADRRGWLSVVRSTDPSRLPFLLEQRRAALGLRQRLSDFPLLLSDPAGKPCKKFDTTLRIASPTCSRDSAIGSSVPLYGENRSVTPCFSEAAYCSGNSNAALESSSAYCEPSSKIGADAILFANRFYKQLYPRIIRDIKRVDENWSKGLYRLIRIPCRSDTTKGVYCLQYDSEKIVSGLRDDTIKVWRRKAHVRAPVASDTPDALAAVETQSTVMATESLLASAGESVTPFGWQPTAAAAAASTMPLSSPMNSTLMAPSEADGHVANHPFSYAPVGAIIAPQVNSSLIQLPAVNPTRTPSATDGDGYECTQVLEGHTGSVLCLQYEGNLLISGSSDSSVRLWDLSTGECLHTLRHHNEAVLHLRFHNNILVTCSKDRSIAVWDMGPYPQDIELGRVLAGHRAAVNVVDFDEKFIVSASGDRTIKVWTTDTANLVRTLTGHRRGIACLQYRAPLIVSGSSDNTIRIWDIESGVCFRVLEGHDELVRCIRFDSKRIVSGAYDGKIKVWNLKAALNSRSRTNQLCMLTLHQHTGRVFRLQFDDFQIVSSSHDDSIIIWDFVGPAVGQEECDDDGFADAPWPTTGSRSSAMVGGIGPGASGSGGVGPSDSNPVAVDLDNDSVSQDHVDVFRTPVVIE